MTQIDQSESFPTIFLLSITEKKSPPFLGPIGGLAAHRQVEEQGKYRERDSYGVTVWMQDSPKTHLHLYPSLVLLQLGFCNMQPKES